MPNTIVKVTGTKANDMYVQLDSAQTIRIDKADVKLLDSAYAPIVRKASAFKLVDKGEYTDIVIPITDRPAYLVDEGPSGLTLTLYGTNGPVKRQLAAKAPAASYIRTVTATGDETQMHYAFDLKGPVYGYQPLWDDGVFTFRVRRPPKIDAASHPSWA